MEQPQLDLDLEPESETRAITVRERARRLPYQKHSRSSFEATNAAQRTQAAIHERIVELLHVHGSLSDRQIQDLMILSGDTERPRRIELANAGIITKHEEIVLNGRRQMTWKLTEPNWSWREMIAHFPLR